MPQTQPVTEPPYQCDYVDSNGVACTNTFLLSTNSYVAYINTCNNPAIGGVIAGFNCPIGMHYYCSHDHAVGGTTYCFNNHMIPERNRRITQYNTDHPDQTPLV